MRVLFLGQEDPLEEMAIHSSILAWRTPWTEESVGLQSKDLAFQVSVQYYSLQHQTLLSPPNTSTLSIISALTEPLHPFWLYLCALLMSCLFAFSYCSWVS